MEQRERPPRDSSTFLNHTHSDAGGRFAAVGAATVMGQTPNPYPALPASLPWDGADPVPDEPPLGYRIDAMIPDDPVRQGQGDASDASSSLSSPLVSERDASLLFKRRKL
jgi:hypothetical protein